MTIKSLPGQEPKESKKSSRGEQEDKPVIREFIKRTGVSDGTAYPVIKAKLTMNGWLLIETTEWVGFINGKATVAITLLSEIAPSLHNQEANMLVAVISKKNKFGFVLGIDDESKRWYTWDGEAYCLTIDEEQNEDFLLPTGVLTLEDFIGTASSSLKDAGQPPVEKSKAKLRSKNSQKDTTES